MKVKLQKFRCKERQQLLQVKGQRSMEARLKLQKPEPISSRERLRKFN